MRYAVLGGVAAGMLLRLAFSGRAGSPWSAMAGTFIFLALLLVALSGVELPLPPAFGMAQRGLHIQAPPAVGWAHLLNCSPTATQSAA